MQVPRLKASALAYTLIIGLLITFMLASCLMLWTFNRSYSDKVYFQELAGDNFDSGANLILYSGKEEFGAFKEMLFGQEVDRFEINSRLWGVYGLMSGKGKHGKFERADVKWFGQVPRGNYEASLFIRDQSRPLNVTGRTRLTGPIYVPEAGIRRGYVGSRNFIGSTLFEGAKHSSKNIHLMADYSRLDDLRRIWSDLSNGVLGPEMMPMKGDTILGDWNEDIRIVGGTGEIFLSDCRIEGHVVITGDEIWIDKSARLKDVLVFGRKIHVLPGFLGSVQAFATDSIVVDSMTVLKFPSALVVAHPRNEGVLKIGPYSEVEGTLINDALVWGRGTQKAGYTLIAKNSIVKGLVYVPYNLDIRGEVRGHVMTSNFLLKVSGSVNENYLMDAVIGPFSDSSWQETALILPPENSYHFIQRKLGR